MGFLDAAVGSFFGGLGGGGNNGGGGGQQQQPPQVQMTPYESVQNHVGQAQNTQTPWAKFAQYYAGPQNSNNFGTPNPNPTLPNRGTAQAQQPQPNIPWYMQGYGPQPPAPAQPPQQPQQPQAQWQGNQPPQPQQPQHPGAPGMPQPPKYAPSTGYVPQRNPDQNWGDPSTQQQKDEWNQYHSYTTGNNPIGSFGQSLGHWMHTGRWGG